jgi:hypothetical protein
MINMEIGAHLEAFCEPYGDDIHIAWDQFWPGWSTILPLEFSYDPIKIFARVFWHLRFGSPTHSLPRRLPVKFRYCDQNGRDAYHTCKNSRSPEVIAKHFHSWTSSRVSGVVIFLEIWIDTSGRNDVCMDEIARALMKLQRKKGGRPSPFEAVHDITFGNVIATLVLNSKHSPNGIRAATKVLDALLRLTGRRWGHAIIPLFNDIICRLGIDDIILALYLVTEVLSGLIFEEKDRRAIIWELFQAVVQEIWALTTTKQADFHIRGLLTCIHIILYLASHQTYYQEEYSIYDALSTLAIHEIGEHAVQRLWYCIGEGEEYERLDRQATDEMIKVKEFMELEPDPEPRRNVAELPGHYPSAFELPADISPRTPKKSRRPKNETHHTARSEPPSPPHSSQSSPRNTPRQESNGQTPEPYRKVNRLPPPPPRPDLTIGNFSLNPIIQGVQRNTEHDKKLQDLVESPDMLREELRKERERIKIVVAEAGRGEGRSKKKQRAGWTWLLRSKAA